MIDVSLQSGSLIDGNQMPRISCALVVALMTFWSGCGGVEPVTGGTTGTLHVGRELLSDIQVTIHRVEGGSTEPIGFGVTRFDGSFELMTNGAQGPLWLTPGEYRFTLESSGAPVEFPKQYHQAATTPLKVSRSSAEETLDLKIPAVKLMQ